MTELSPNPPENLSGLDALGELVLSLPRVLNRTRSQAAMLRGLAALLPCVGGHLADDSAAEVPTPPVAEPTDVLAVLAAPAVAGRRGAAGGEGTAAIDAGAGASAAHSDPEPVVPSERDLAVQDYDSLAASQVVPRLAVLTPGELKLIAAYESAHRNRQTILNRVAQVLAE